MTLPEVPGWLGLLRIYRHERNPARGRPYSARKLAAETGLSYGLIKETFDGTITPTLGTVELIISALDIPEIDAAIIRRELTPRNDFAPIFDVRSDAQILADAMNNLAEAIREHARAVEGHPR